MINGHIITHLAVFNHMAWVSFPEKATIEALLLL